MQSKNLYAPLVLLALLTYSCNNNDKTADKKAGEDSSAIDKPIPQHYKPALDGQTRTAVIKTTTPYKVERLAEHLGRPWAVIAMPDGNLLLTDKSGFMQVLSADGKLIRKISGFPNVVDSNQGGMLDVALDPAFASNHTIYWSFSEKYKKGNVTAIAKGQLLPNDTLIKKPVVIFRALPEWNSTYHYGSRLLFDKEGYLFVSASERALPEPRQLAQKLDACIGKILRITTDGKPAPGNPFINQPGARPEIYSYGHRNPQSLDFDPVTGDLWEAEFGPMGGDELNLIKPGKNYGWPIITYGIDYDGKKMGDSIQQKEGMEQPVYFWDPVISPSGMIFYTSDSIPEWKNNLFISGLSSTRIVRLVIKDHKVVGEETLLHDQQERIRDITQLNGKLYAVSDGGVLFCISKK
jgi:aldose sugar dehydrogenase